MSLTSGSKKLNVNSLKTDNSAFQEKKKRTYKCSKFLEKDIQVSISMNPLNNMTGKDANSYTEQ